MSSKHVLRPSNREISAPSSTDPAARLRSGAEEIRLAAETGDVGHADELSQIWARLLDIADELEEER